MRTVKARAFNRNYFRRRNVLWGSLLLFSFKRLPILCNYSQRSSIALRDRALPCIYLAYPSMLRL